MLLSLLLKLPEWSISCSWSIINNLLSIKQLVLHICHFDKAKLKISIRECKVQILAWRVFHKILTFVFWCHRIHVTGLHIRGAVSDGRDPQAARDHGALAAAPAPAPPPQLRRARLRRARAPPRSTGGPHGGTRSTYNIVSTLSRT